jgi:ubiquinone/menaquinone biosynthesis C-methylase UbiE
MKKYDIKIKVMSYKKIWDKSYKNKDNYLFYPNEEVIRFVNKYIERKTTLTTKNKNKYFLDIGCGSGRHIKYIVENGYFCYGVDISSKALNYAKSFLDLNGYNNKQFKLVNCNSSQIPLPSTSIDYIVAEAALDSMPDIDIKKTIDEAQRLLKSGGLLYCSLIKLENKKNLKLNYKYLGNGNYKVNTRHEKNTIQVFFDKKKITKYFSDFIIKDIVLVKRLNLNNKSLSELRYHLVCQKK